MEGCLVVFVTGGLGTMDELFELMTLIQLNKIGTKFRVPVILCNYDGFYDGLLTFLVVRPCACFSYSPSLGVDDELRYAASQETAIGCC
jgi:hypothetical protein